jgi:uncharacterized protein YigE (DUF2233 family)
MLSLIKKMIVPLFVCFLSGMASAKTSWRPLSPGLWYTQITTSTLISSGTLHAFRVDLNYYRFSLALAKEYEGQFASAQNLTIASKGIVGINGGFFAPDMSSLGLRISDGEQLSRFKQSPWWGVFLIQNHHAKVLSASQYHTENNVDFAVQSGPRLLVDGQIPQKLRPGVANRSALGIRRNGQVVILATQNISLSTLELAQIMQRSEPENGLACWQALNLDGGSSTQLYAKVNDFMLSIPSFMPVADVVVVMPRLS